MPKMKREKGRVVHSGAVTIGMLQPRSVVGVRTSARDLGSDAIEALAEVRRVELADVARTSGSAKEKRAKALALSMLEADEARKRKAEGVSLRGVMDGLLDSGAAGAVATAATSGGPAGAGAGRGGGVGPGGGQGASAPSVFAQARKGTNKRAGAVAEFAAAFYTMKSAAADPVSLLHRHLEGKLGTDGSS
jgi:hypothetical protein